MELSCRECQKIPRDEGWFTAGDCRLAPVLLGDGTFRTVKYSLERTFFPQWMDVCASSDLLPSIEMRNKEAVQRV